MIHWSVGCLFYFKLGLILVFRCYVTFQVSWNLNVIMCSIVPDVHERSELNISAVLSVKYERCLFTWQSSHCITISCKENSTYCTFGYEAVTSNVKLSNYTWLNRSISLGHSVLMPVCWSIFKTMCPTNNQMDPCRAIICKCMMTSSNGNISVSLAICAGNSPVTGEFPSQWPVKRSFDVFFDLRPN